MLPLSLLNAATSKDISVELKSGAVISGRLVATDAFMNIRLSDATEVHAGSARSFPEYYVKGILIKYVHVPEDTLDEIKEERFARMQELRSQRA